MKTIVITVITYHYLCSLLRVFTVLGTIYLPAHVQDYQILTRGMAIKIGIGYDLVPKHMANLRYPAKKKQNLSWLVDNRIDSKQPKD